MTDKTVTEQDDGVEIARRMAEEEEGVGLVILLLEAARRVIGPALPVIAGLFIVYAFSGPYMPDLIAFKGTSMNRFVGQMTMSTEGIYGIPLDVSATIVFLFVLFGPCWTRPVPDSILSSWP
jgi:TRAP-type uncharacterized transport system fused permease subunit